MPEDNEVFDVVIIGAGPSGLACAIAAKKFDFNYLLLEKGCLVNSIFHFPSQMIFFSTPELLEIGNIPFIISNEKPARADLLKYYRAVTEHYELNLRMFENVEAVTGQSGGFSIQTGNGRAYTAANIVLATGQYDRPNMMGIPGEELNKVSHYFTEAHSFYKKKVVVIGGKNSAVEASLELYKAGADVTLIHRHDDFGQSVKYWILPDIRNRIKENKITAHFNTEVKEIRENSIIIEDGSGKQTAFENDFVFALTGYNPDTAFFRKLGIGIEAQQKPVHNPKTLETNISGIYVAGVITAGSDGSKVFIENSRHHGDLIMGNILNGSKN